MIQNTFRFPDDLYWRLREMAGDNRLSKNAQALILLDEGLEAHGYQRAETAAEEQPKARAPDADLGGTRPKMDDEKAAQAKQMIADGLEIADVAAHFGVHRSTLYNYIGATGRIGSPEVKMTAAKKAEAWRLRAEGMPGDEVAEALGVSVATLYKHIGPIGRAHKLTEDQVRRIKVRLAPKPGEPRGEPDSTLALEFGVSPRTIGLIRHGRTWRHVVIEA